MYQKYRSMNYSVNIARCSSDYPKSAVDIPIM
jgi:hypothetical protein